MDLQEKKNIQYKSKRDRYENLSPEEYLDMVKPYLRDLIIIIKLLWNQIMKKIMIEQNRKFSQ